MKRNEELNRENRQLRERLTKLIEASLRISESLDIDTVLRDVAGSARVLCGAGRVSTLDYLPRRVRRSRRGGSPRIVRVYVKRLRDKLGDDPKRPAYILNERGVGYRVPKPEA